MYHPGFQSPPKQKRGWDVNLNKRYTWIITQRRKQKPSCHGCHPLQTQPGRFGDGAGLGVPLLTRDKSCQQISLHWGWGSPAEPSSAQSWGERSRKSLCLELNPTKTPLSSLELFFPLFPSSAGALHVNVWLCWSCSAAQVLLFGCGLLLTADPFWPQHQPRATQLTPVPPGWLWDNAQLSCGTRASWEDF